jgi:flagellar motility protein MotE (MotC chaperone)
MNRILEILAMTLGGFSLFAVCFLGFASMAGVAPHELSVVGRFFPQPDPEPKEELIVDVAADAPPEATPPETEGEVLASSLGVLGAWSLTPPFTAEELKGLADELKLKRMQLNRSLEDQSARQRDLDAREAMLVEQFQALEDLRARLEASEQDLLLRAEAVSRDEAAAGEQEERKWTKLAALFGALAPADAGVKLTAYPPAEATEILLRLDQDLALEILNTLTGDRYMEYAGAWAAASPVAPDTRR